MAEFLIDTARGQKDVDEFKRQVAGLGLGEALNDVLVERLWSIIMALTPGGGEREGVEGVDGVGGDMGASPPSSSRQAGGEVDRRDRIWSEGVSPALLVGLGGKGRVSSWPTCAHAS